MEREPVKSSNIASIGYNPNTLTLEIEFHSGNIYQYEPITEEGYLDMKKADSIGLFFHKHIIDNDTINVTVVS